MNSTPYLAELAARLARGTSMLPGSFRDRQTRYLLGRQDPDGGFTGREGPSDLYYTAFALRLGALLNVREPKFWHGALVFVRKNSLEPADVVEVHSLLTMRAALALRGLPLWCEACRDERVTACQRTLRMCRLPSGGFAKTPHGEASLYHTFLATLSCELLNEPTPGADELAELVKSRQSSSGGFGDLAESAAEGTNATAAAVGILKALGRLDEATAAGAAGFLIGMQRRDGGFVATSETPVADLLSTFTALVTLFDGDAVHDVKLGSVGRFVKSLGLPDGGFRAARADDASDVEYAYYGLGTLALLGEYAASRRRPCCEGKTCCD